MQFASVTNRSVITFGCKDFQLTQKCYNTQAVVLKYNIQNKEKSAMKRESPGFNFHNAFVVFLSVLIHLQFAQLQPPELPDILSALHSGSFPVLHWK